MLDFSTFSHNFTFIDFGYNARFILTKFDFSKFDFSKFDFRRIICKI